MKIRAVFTEVDIGEDILVFVHFLLGFFKSLGVFVVSEHCTG